MIRLRQLCSVSLGLCQSNVTHTVDVPCSDESYCSGYPFRKDISGGYCGGVPPLPIPNREVKPTYADGTAMQCGRVGSRLLFQNMVKLWRIKSPEFFYYLKHEYCKASEASLRLLADYYTHCKHFRSLITRKRKMKSIIDVR